MNEKNFLLIDGFNLLSRGYFATSYGRNIDELPKNSRGEYINAARVFWQKLQQLIDTYAVTDLSIAWDGKRSDILRTQKYDFYKAQRSDLPEPLVDQYELIKELLMQAGIHQMDAPGYEADDVIGTWSRHWPSRVNGNVWIYSNDKDMLQLINENVAQVIAKKKEEVIYRPELFRQEFQLEPSQWVDVKALLGDPSDNIPGCPGVGEKSAYPLIQTYGDLQTLYQVLAQGELDERFKRYKKKLIEGEEKVNISYELATIITDLDAVRSLPAESVQLGKSQQELQEKAAERGILTPRRS
ncbi:5'-3' exonuclease [Salisediminibacterium halotolerans]|uniref:5'-3' exonuclease n=1 Tax=Salisediminibacterium halotolerans TaxID=517425 RepID=A0A1H9RQC0_9BACI|nr:5'-3' exonuclease [Salisediminibacterium haloalkalitolerans]SER74738.1 5'-3' exonuclease [Salisediminibacterium haloalkalitolerans]